MVTDSDTSVLLTRAQAGDESAHDQLLVRYRQRLRRMIVVLLDNRVSARLDPSDILQDAFEIALRRLPTYLTSRPVPFYPWLRQIVKEQVIDAHRRHIQALRRSVACERQLDFQLSDLSAGQLASQLVCHEPSPGSVVDQREMVKKVQQAMGELSAQDQEVLLMRFIEQLSVSEVGEALAISENTAKARVRRAIERLGRRVFYSREFEE